MPISIKKFFYLAYQARFWCIVLSIFSFYGNIDLWENTSIPIILKWVVISFFFSLLLSITSVIKPIYLRLIGIILCCIQILLSIVNFFCYEIWGLGFNERILTIITETNRNEIDEFLLSFNQFLFSFVLMRPTIIMVVSLIVFLIIIKKISFQKYRLLTVSVIPLGFILSIIHISVFDTGKRDLFMLGKTALWVDYSLKMRNMIIDEQMGYHTHSSFSNQDISLGDSLDNIVLVIGESSCRNHWQLYGYSLQTTPLLNNKKDSLAVFTNVLPPFSTTSASLQCVLTTKPSISEKPWYYYTDLINLSKAAGYKTYWYSNQEKVSEFGASIGVIAKFADVTHYEDSLSISSVIGRRAYDEVLIKHMCNALKDTAKHKLIVLHTMGSHIEYCFRYPEKETIFSAKNVGRNKLSEKQKNIVAHYDNSIHYTDKVLSAIIDSLELCDGRNVMLYLSDHSEDVYETSNVYRHAFKGGNLVKIPMIIWMNKKFREVHPEMSKRVYDKQKEPITSENIIYSMIKLMGINSKIYHSQQDFLSDDYICKERYFENKRYNHQ